MTTDQPDTVDSPFYAFVHDHIQRQCPNTGDERRSSVRNPCQTALLIAPKEKSDLPMCGDFQSVMCSDLSCSGFSYEINEPPTTDHLVVALGAVPFTFLLAEIRNIVHNEQENAEYRIGCHFVDRVDASATK